MSNQFEKLPDSREFFVELRPTKQGYGLYSPGDKEVARFKKTDTLQTLLLTMIRLHQELPVGSAISIEVQHPHPPQYPVDAQTRPYLKTFIRPDGSRYCLVVSWPVPLEEREESPDYNPDWNPVPHEYGKANIDPASNLGIFYNFLVATIVGNGGIAMLFNPLIQPPLPKIFGP